MENLNNPAVPAPEPQKAEGPRRGRRPKLNKSPHLPAGRWGDKGPLPQETKPKANGGLPEFKIGGLSQKQTVALVVALIVVLSSATSLATVMFIFGERPAAIIERIVEKQTEPTRLINEKILRQDELVVRVVKIASPGVVSIVATKDVPVIEQFFIDPFADDPFLRQFFGDQFQVPQFRQKGTRREDVSRGSGFVVSGDGLIITNRHVVEDASADYTVFFSDGTKFAAEVLARDPFQDLAVLKVNPPPGEQESPLSPLVLGDSDDVQIGQSVVAIGNALGEFQNTVSVGIVSGLKRTVIAQGQAGSEVLSEVIQTDAAINPGNSGGPLLNLRGEVIGINTAIAQGAENIGFALPINKAKRDIESVKASGRIIYPFIGIRYVILNKELQEENGLPVDYGAWIVGALNEPAITAGSPAEKAGLRAGDIILKISGERIDYQRTLASHLLKYNVGETIILAALRDGKEMEVKVTLEERK